MIVRFLNAMVEGEEKELLKLEIHQLVVKVQYGISPSSSLGDSSVSCESTIWNICI